MTRLAATLDRVAALIFGLALMALGAGLLVWSTDWLPEIPQVITARGLVTAAGTAWWPWAVAGTGIVLVLTALRWLFTHTPKTKVKVLRLSGGPTGSVTANLGAVAAAAARALEQSPGIHSATGKALIDRGTRTIELALTAYSPENLTTLTEPIDTVSTQIAGMLEDPFVATRTTIHIDKHPRRQHRVE